MQGHINGNCSTKLKPKLNTEKNKIFPYSKVTFSHKYNLDRHRTQIHQDDNVSFISRGNLQSDPAEHLSSSDESTGNILTVIFLAPTFVNYVP